MSNDKNLFVSEVSDSSVLDLRLGNPLFLEEFWRKIVSFDNRSVKLHDLMGYRKARAESFLTDRIKELHRSVGNVKNIDDCQVVVGYGASQILMATMLAMKNLYDITGVNAEAPHWPRFGTLAHLSGLPFEGSTRPRNAAYILTSPNNPDGNQNLNDKLAQSSAHKIFDLSYNWPTYTDKLRNEEDLVSVFSFAKLSGHASTRIGWALVRDKELADEMNHQIEILTSGVSIEAQDKASCVIENIQFQMGSGFESVFSYGSKVLSQRWAKINELAAKTDRFTLLSENGMFLYMQLNGKSSILEEAGIWGISGSAFGDNESNVRLTIGNSTADFNEMVTRLEKHL